MRSFAPGFLEEQPISRHLEEVLRELRDYRGTEEHCLDLRPLEVRRVLWESAIFDSVRSSNRIEGVVVPESRLRELVQRRRSAIDRADRDVAGYHAALREFLASGPGSRFSPENVLHLYRLFDDTPPYYSRPPDLFKCRNEVDLEAPLAGSRVEWLATVPAAETPETLEELQGRFEGQRRDGGVEPLLLVAAYVLDFVMIHPFRTGNGRLARLLTSLLLQREGYEVGRYVSLERILEGRLQAYRDAFSESAPGWHHSLHDLLPWWEFFLESMLLTAYRELEAWAEATPAVSGYKGEVVEATVERLLPARFRVREVLEAYPGRVSRATVNRALRRLRAAGRLELARSGRGALWAKR